MSQLEIKDIDTTYHKDIIEEHKMPIVASLILSPGHYAEL